MGDLWLPRIHLLGQLVIVVVCGTLIGFGHDSIIIDLFCAASGGLIATTTYQKITEKKATTAPTGESDT